MKGRQLRTRKVHTGLIKPFHVRTRDLRHPMADEFAQYAWSSDFAPTQLSVAARPLYTLISRREVCTDSGSRKWEYKGRYQEGSESPWLTEVEVLDSFTPLQLDVFHALWNLYHPSTPSTQNAPSRKTNPHLERARALQVFPIGTRGIKSFHGQDQEGQVYDYHDKKWRVRYPDNYWEELTRRDMEQFVRKSQRESAR